MSTDTSTPRADLIFSVIRFSPRYLNRMLFQLLATVMLLRNGKSARILKSNISRVLGNKTSSHYINSVCKENIASYFDCYLEVCRLPSMTQPDLHSAITAEGVDRIKTYLDSGNGLILVTPRMGNIELLAGWLATSVGPFMTVAAQHNSKIINEILLAERSKFDIKVLKTRSRQGSGGGTPPLPFFVLSQHLKDGGLVCLVGDSAGVGNGVKVEFFHQSARFPGGPAALALRTGAPIITAAIWNSEDIYAGKVSESPLKIPHTGSWKSRIAELTQMMAVEFEEFIRGHPSDWHYFDDIFDLYHL